MNSTAAIPILEQVLSLAKAPAVTASLSAGTTRSTRFSDNAITQNVQCTDASLRVECAFGQSHGAASTNDLSPAALEALVRRAEEIARVSPPDPEYMPPVDGAESRKYKQVRAHFEGAVSPLKKAQDIAAAAGRIQSQGLRFSGAYADGEHFRALANSAGLRALHRFTEGDIHASVLGADGSGWAEQITSNVAELDLPGAADRALAIARDAQKPRDLEPGKYTVILSPAALGELLIFAFWGGFDAKATDEGRTFLRGKLGKQICGANITIRSDPTDPRCPATPFCPDGLVSPTLPWIEQGVVKNLFYSRYWAKEKGQAPTGWPSNILMDGGPVTADEMIASTKRGLLITRFWYIRFVDPMVPLATGMTRDGLFLIEDGKIARPVKNMRFNVGLVDVLSHVEALGPTARTYDIMVVPTVKVRDFNFTSTTKF